MSFYLVQYRGNYVKKYHVDIRGLQVGEGYPVRLMGVVNLSTESFYKKSVVTRQEDIQDMIQRLEQDGADIIDIGGASSAPKNVYGTTEISENEEMNRIETAMKTIVECTKLPLSVDTTSSRVAEVALDTGAHIINDISGLKADSEIAKVVADYEVPIILMANCETPCENIRASLSAIEQSIRVALDVGISNEKIIIDPGIGFGKPSKVDYSILRDLDQFTALCRPLLVGVSRKAFIGTLLEQRDPADRLVGSLAATAIAVYKGANMIRTHDIIETKQAVKVAEAIRGQLINFSMDVTDGDELG